MTKRCRHVWKGKTEYPDDLYCEKCQIIYSISDYTTWNAEQLLKLPVEVRREVLKKQTAEFVRSIRSGEIQGYDDLVEKG